MITAVFEKVIRPLWALGFPRHLPIRTLLALCDPIYEVSQGCRTLTLRCWISISTVPRGIVIINRENFSFLAFRTLWGTGFPRHLPIRTLFALYDPIYEVSYGCRNLTLKCWISISAISRVIYLGFLLLLIGTKNRIKITDQSGVSCSLIGRIIQFGLLWLSIRLHYIAIQPLRTCVLVSFEVF